MGEYPRYPDRYHWRKRFLIPKSYLYKMRVLEGLTSTEIAEWHRKELGVKISKRLVEYYLTKFKIYKPRNFTKKKKYKRPPFDQPQAVWYLNKCLQLRRYPFRYLDGIMSTRRRKIVNRFFRMSAELDHLSRTQKKILWCVLKRYEVFPATADLLFPKRHVMINWGKVDELRIERGHSLSGFCRSINVERMNYKRSRSKGFIKTKRKTVVKIRCVLKHKESLFSKEIKHG